MENLTYFNTGSWLGIFSAILIVLCLYFTLTFFQHLKDGDVRLTNQSKLGAVICLALALLIPTAYNFYIFTTMKR